MAHLGYELLGRAPVAPRGAPHLQGAPRVVEQHAILQAVGGACKKNTNIVSLCVKVCKNEF